MSQISSDAMATAVRALAPSVLDGAPAFIGICDSKFKPIYLNPAGREMVRFPEHQLIANVAISDFFVRDQRALIARIGLPAVAREGQWEQEASFRDWSDPKHELDVHYFAFGLYDDRKALLGGVTITREIVTRKNAVGAVRESQAMVNELLGMLPLDIGIFDGAARTMEPIAGKRESLPAGLRTPRLNRPAGCGSTLVDNRRWQGSEVGPSQRVAFQWPGQS